MSKTDTLLPALAFLDRELSAVDPEILHWIREEERRQNQQPGADRLGELGVARRAGGAGLRADEQVRGGVSRQALLRRLRVRRPCRAARDRPRQGALRRRARQRAAALGLPGEHVRVPDGAQARRHDPRNGSFARRPPDARASALVLGPRVQGRGLRRAARGRAHRLRAARGAGARAPPEDDHRGRVRLRARDRLRALRPGRRRGRRRPDGRRRARGGADRRRAARLSGAARPVRDDDDAQDAAGPARRSRALPRRPRQGPRPQRLPGHAGRAARARHRGQGGRVRRGRRRRSSPTTSAGSSRTRRPWPRPCRPAASGSCRAAPTTT